MSLFPFFKISSESPRKPKNGLLYIIPLSVLALRSGGLKARIISIYFTSPCQHGSIEFIPWNKLDKNFKHVLELFSCNQ